MQAGQVSSFPAFSFGHANISSVQTWAKAKTSVSIQLAMYTGSHGNSRPCMLLPPSSLRVYISAWGVVMCCGFSPSTPPSFTPCPGCLPKKQHADPKKKKCSHYLSLLILDCHTFHVRGNNYTVVGLGFGVCVCWLHKVTVHDFSILAICFFSTSLQFCLCSKHFSLFYLLVKHKTGCDNISFFKVLFREWIACCYSTLVLSEKAEFTFLRILS